MHLMRHNYVIINFSEKCVSRSVATSPPRKTDLALSTCHCHFNFELGAEGEINAGKDTPSNGTLMENKQTGQFKQRRSSSQSRLFSVSSFAPDKCLWS